MLTHAAPQPTRATPVLTLVTPMLTHASPRLAYATQMLTQADPCYPNAAPVMTHAHPSDDPCYPSDNTYYPNADPCYPNDDPCVFTMLTHATPMPTYANPHVALLQPHANPCQVCAFKADHSFISATLQRNFCQRGQTLLGSPYRKDHSQRSKRHSSSAKEEDWSWVSSGGCQNRHLMQLLLALQPAPQLSMKCGLQRIHSAEQAWAQMCMRVGVHV